MRNRTQLRYRRSGLRYEMNPVYQKNAMRIRGIETRVIGELEHNLLKIYQHNFKKDMVYDLFFINKLYSYIKDMDRMKIEEGSKKNLFACCVRYSSFIFRYLAFNPMMPLNYQEIFGKIDEWVRKHDGMFGGIKNHFGRAYLLCVHYKSLYEKSRNKEKNK